VHRNSDYAFGSNPPYKLSFVGERTWIAGRAIEGLRGAAA